MWTLGIKVACEADSKYPLLANTDGGAVHLQVVCRGLSANKEFYSYVFDDFQAVDNLIKAGVRVGFAFPMQGDEFRVIRFSLTGSGSAVTNMWSIASKMNVNHQHGKTATSDQSIYSNLPGTRVSPLS
jgi:hypothetical protein